MTPAGQLMIYNDNWYLMHNDEVARLPKYLRYTLVGKSVCTCTFGPYDFYNYFEETTDAKYLMEMFQHIRLTPTPSKRVQQIIHDKRDWVKLNLIFAQALSNREKEFGFEFEEPWNGNKN